MISYFFLIPYGELTQRMLNLSVSQDKTSIPLKTFEGIISPFYILEVVGDNIRDVVFSNYRPYSAKEIVQITPTTLKILREGIILSTVAAGQSNTATYAVQRNKIISGIVFKSFNTNPGDKLTIKVFSALDVELSTIISGSYVSDDLREIKVMPTLVPAGVVIKATYENVGLKDATFFINVYWSDENA